MSASSATAAASPGPSRSATLPACWPANAVARRSASSRRRSAPASPSWSTSGSRSQATLSGAVVLMPCTILRARSGTPPVRPLTFRGRPAYCRPQDAGPESATRAQAAEVRGRATSRSPLPPRGARASRSSNTGRSRVSYLTFGPMVVETERLVLRRWHAEDRAPLAAINADPEVMRWIGGGRVLGRGLSDELVDRFGREGEQRGYGLWAVAWRGDPAGGPLGLLGPAGAPLLCRAP